MRRFLRIVLMVTLVSMIATFLPKRFAHVDNNEDLLDVVFGNAREMISISAVEKADIYYHGGVGHADGDDCTGEDHTHDENCSHNHDENCSHNHGENCSHNHDENCSHNHDEKKREFSPWQWLNNRLHPQMPRHMNLKEEAAEILPWLWLAIKADPENIDNLELAVYWLKRNGQDEKTLIEFLRDYGRKSIVAKAQYKIALSELYAQINDNVKANELLVNTLENIPQENAFIFLNLIKRFAIVAKKTNNKNALKSVLLLVENSKIIDEQNKIKIREFCNN